MKTKTQNLGQKILSARVLLRAVICTLVLVAFTYPDSGYAATKPVKVSVEDEEEAPEPIIIEDKTSQFSDVLGEASTSDNDSSKSALAEKIRAQRAALDARDAVDTANAKMQNSMANGQNACDFGLRECMKKKCGNNYSKCAKDTDTLWGDKMDACRRDLPCTGEEYRIFTTEIKADRDMNTKIASYTSIIECGNRYNDCVITECGKTFSKCLGKSAGDKAIEKCKKIANECKEQDSGLPSRMMEVFGTLRQDAEKQIKKDEEKLYSLRDAMGNACKMLGAMFDERTLDCVYTVNFYAGDKSTLFASKKAYAGSTFNCDQNWFGIDVTTFKENAYRLTRSQTAASSAMLGSGVGTAVGAITSGALNRSLDRQKAEKALKDAKDEDKECNKNKDCGDGQKCKKGVCVDSDSKKGDDDDDNSKDEDKGKEQSKTDTKGKDKTPEVKVGDIKPTDPREQQPAVGNEKGPAKYTAPAEIKANMFRDGNGQAKTIGSISTTPSLSPATNTSNSNSGSSNSTISGGGTSGGGGSSNSSSSSSSSSSSASSSSTSTAGK